ncbi:DUF4190 domain-containing protein [Micromonospora sp. KC213]|uniref:DUF4190 domain-containing protein n=1 Tax=Micromonospora sp. KC213 TaxID=2530378 RepID=UPI0010448B7F|nr:DUF4190 domain-containing protein [Micromonospora sp. KC213]TDC36166.1 DUF4190 domain-containing protein [Micromonospora sp. KC213]
MTYPPPADGWSNPTGDPTQPVGQPVPTQPTGDPSLPVAKDPYAVPPQAAPADPYAVPPQAAPADPYAVPPQAAPADPYAVPPQAAPADAYPTPGYPPAGYPGYGYPPAPQNNGLAIAAMVVSIIGALGLCGYGLGGWIGLVGAILGHVAKRQIRERGEAGEGFAMAGVIVGWIATVIALLATIAIVVFIIWAANQDSSSFDSTSY